jgi:putative DNA primase/helicase
MDNDPTWPFALGGEAITTPSVPREKLLPITGAELLRKNIPPRHLLLAPYLPEAGIVMLYAPRGIGKTWVALSVAYAVASGGSVLNGTASAPRKVLYIDGEMVLALLQERLGKVAIGAGVNLPDDDFLQFLPADLFRDGLPDLASPDGRALVEELAEGMALVVFDNLSSLCRYKENEADAWQPIQDMLLSLRRRGIASLIVHHAGKAGQQRGTSRREDALDTVIALRRPDEHEATQGARFHWHFEKARGFMGDDAAPFEAVLVQGEHGVSWQTAPLVKSQKAVAVEMLGAGAKPADVVKATGAPSTSVYRWAVELREGRDGIN